MMQSNALDIIVDIARDAGRIILKFYTQEIQIETKADNSPLTAADLAANTFIEQALKQHFPDIPVLSEETHATFPLPFNGARYWLVDPLDGTKEFIQKNGEFTVNIALIVHNIPVMGVVYAPAMDTIYYAREGNGAFKQQGSESPVSIHVNTAPHASPKIACSRSHADHHLQAWLDKFGAHTLIPMGSSLKICSVAEGIADIYPRTGPTSLWDIGAAHAVLREAGGSLTSMDGDTINYHPTGDCLNPWFIAAGSPSFYAHVDI